MPKAEKSANEFKIKANLIEVGTGGGGLDGRNCPFFPGINGITF
jgi:hypothetical protein